MFLPKLFSFYFSRFNKDSTNTCATPNFLDINKECILYIQGQNINPQFHDYVNFLSKEFTMTKVEVIEYILDREERLQVEVNLKEVKRLQAENISFRKL